MSAEEQRLIREQGRILEMARDSLISQRDDESKWETVTRGNRVARKKTTTNTKPHESYPLFSSNGPLANNDNYAEATSTNMARRPGARKTLLCLFYPACLHSAAACKFLHICTDYSPDQGDPSCINPDCVLDHPRYDVLCAAQSNSVSRRIR